MQEHRVLARKWRPSSFADVVGQEHVLKALRHALSSGRLHHAYLFTGTRGVGKTTLARVLARALNCETGVTPDPCGVCDACRAIEEGRFVDLIELDAASNTQVDKMRELLENATYAPTAGRFKVYVIDEVHQLSGSAFNAMLKTLEEPPEHVKFVLATTDPQKIPVTVLSRCLQFGLKPIPAATIASRMSHILGEEGVEADAAAVDLLARAARGSLRDGLSLLDQAIAYGGGRLATDAVAEMLGVADVDALLAVLDAVSRGDAAAGVAAADAVVERGVSLDAALQEMARLIKQAALARALAEPPSDLPAALLELTGRLSHTDLQVLYQIATHARAELDWAPDPESGFVMAVLRMLALAGPPSAGEVVEPRAATQVAPVAAAVRSAPEARQEAPEPPARAEPSAHAEPPTQAEPPVAAQDPFDGDWPALLPRLRLVGMPRMLAERCVLAGAEGERLRLQLAAAHRGMLDPAAQERIEREVRSALGDAWRIAIEVVADAPAAATPMQQREAVKAERQARATESIEGDPFVRGLLDEMGGRLVEPSVRPLQADSVTTEQGTEP